MPTATSSSSMRTSSFETRTINGALGWMAFDSLTQIR